MSRSITVTVHRGVGPGEYTADLRGGCAHVRAGSQIAGTEMPVLAFGHDEKLLDELCAELSGYWAGSPADMQLVRDVAKSYALQLLHKHLRDSA